MVGHGSHEFGVANGMYCDTEGKIGIILFLNTTIYDQDQRNLTNKVEKDLIKRLFEEAYNH